MENCIFCKIITKEIPADIVYEDEKFLVFLDINPVTKGHTLIIPKAHYRWIEDTPDETLHTIFSLAKKVIIAMKKEFSCNFTQLIVEGNEVPHFHVSVIPGFAGKPHAVWNHEEYVSNDEKDAYREKIKNAL